LGKLLLFTRRFSIQSGLGGSELIDPYIILYQMFTMESIIVCSMQSMAEYSRENIKREMLFVLASELGMEVEMDEYKQIVIYTNLMEDKDQNLIPFEFPEDYW
jgi:hypothetical protein